MMINIQDLEDFYRRQGRHRKLSGKFKDYLTDEYGSDCVDVTYPWEILPDEYQDHLDKWWEKLDEDMQSDEAPF